MDPLKLEDEEAEERTGEGKGKEGDHQEANPVHTEEDAVVVKREESESLPSFDSNINIPIFLHDPCVSSLGLGLAFNLVWSGSVSRGDGILVSVSKILIDIKSRTNINVLGKVK